TCDIYFLKFAHFNPIKFAHFEKILIRGNMQEILQICSVEIGCFCSCDLYDSLRVIRERLVLAIFLVMLDIYSSMIIFL
ncbi:MAG: hypothetical protein ACKVLM_23335, partial [Pseudomonadales bacterium]